MSIDFFVLYKTLKDSSLDFCPFYIKYKNVYYLKSILAFKCYVYWFLKRILYLLRVKHSNFLGDMSFLNKWPLTSLYKKSKFVYCAMQFNFVYKITNISSWDFHKRYDVWKKISLTSFFKISKFLLFESKNFAFQMLCLSIFKVYFFAVCAKSQVEHSYNLREIRISNKWPLQKIYFFHYFKLILAFKCYGYRYFV